MFNNQHYYVFVAKVKTKLPGIQDLQQSNDKDIICVRLHFEL